MWKSEKYGQKKKFRPISMKIFLGKIQTILRKKNLIQEKKNLMKKTCSH